MYGDDICRYYEKRESQRLQRIDLELDAILMSVLLIKPHGIELRMLMLLTNKHL